MWYALHYENSRQKKEAVSRLEEMPDTGIGRVVELTYERLRRYEGSWHREKTALFPGYILIESTDEEGLQRRLKRSGIDVRSVNRNTEKLLRELCDEHGNLPMSRGVICKGVTCVTEGPLRGREGIICKIDRHKRLATLKAAFPQKSATICVGLEITEKTL